MSWKDWFKTTGTLREEARQEGLNEAIKAFADKNQEKTTDILAKRGEGLDDFDLVSGFGNIGTSSFQSFYARYLNKNIDSELSRINEYRSMAETTEIADVIEDATNESVEQDQDGKVIHLDIVDKKLAGNENIQKNINKEFYELFYEKINIGPVLWDMFRSYLIDGRIYYERVIDKRHPKQGIISIKKLPCETMDFEIDPMTGKIIAYYQYLSANPKRPATIQEAQQREDVILFNPEQIGYIDYGVYGRDRFQVLGYLEKVRIPFNQLKLLETSVIIYRIVRAPQRLVFRIDTGNMPKDKAHKYVEKVKQKMTKKQTYDPETGTLSNEPNVMCIKKDTEIPLLDGRHLTLENVVEEFKNGKENYVYTINQETLDVESGKIVNAAITRKNEKLVRVWLDDDYIDTTHDHKFVLRDGKEKRADELGIGDSLMPLYRKKSELTFHGNSYDYEKVFNPGTNKWRWTHRVVAGKVKKGQVRHHKDFNRYNHKISNIEFLEERGDTGCITVEGNHNFAVSKNGKSLVFIRNSILENYYMAQSADGRGSNIDTIGGDAKGFTELDDVYYFARKMYRALKYPSSRVTAGEERREADIVFGQGGTGEISRDEIKWAKFLERQQNKFCDEFIDLFLLHMDFKGMKEQYNLCKRSLRFRINPPSKYREQQVQNFLESRFNNYTMLADRGEFSKYYLMKKFLKWDDDEISQNLEGIKKDKELGLSKEDEGKGW